MKSQELNECLRILDNERPLEINRQNIFQPSARIYFYLKALYNNYKKDHELQIMQDKIYNIKIIPKGPASYSFKKVTSKTLCSDRLFSYQDIDRMMKISHFIERPLKKPFVQEINHMIWKLQKLDEILVCYKQMLRNIEWLSYTDIYVLIQQSMIKKILSMDLRGDHFQRIAEFIITLPKIQQNIMTFIAHLFDKVQRIEDFALLYTIFQNNLHQQKLQLYEVKAIVKICHKNHMKRIRQFIKNQYINFQQICLEEIKYKLTLIPQWKKISNKNENIINFIVFMIKKLNITVWEDLIKWQKSFEVDQCLDYFKKKILEDVLEKAAKLEDDYYGVLVQILQKLSVIDIEQFQQINRFLIDYCLKLLCQNKTFRNNPYLIKFISLKLLKYHYNLIIQPSVILQPLENEVLCLQSKKITVYPTDLYIKRLFSINEDSNDSNNSYVDLVLEMFAYQKMVIVMYKYIINNYELFEVFKKYMKWLLQQYPVRFKDMYVKFDQVGKGELLCLNSSPLLRLLEEFKVPIEITLNTIRDLQQFYPSKSIVAIFLKVLSLYKEDKHFQKLKIHIIRCLNILLVKTPVEHINQSFKIYLPTLIKNFFSQDVKTIFAEVPTQTNDELKRSFEEYKKKMG